MNHTNTDYLFQALPAGTSRVPNTTRSDGGSNFDGHLNYASTSVFDAIHAARKTEPAAPSSIRDDSPRDASESDSQSNDYDDRSDADCGSTHPSDSTNCATPGEPNRADDNADLRAEENDDQDDATEAPTVEGAAAQAKPAQQPNQVSAKANAKEAAAAAVEAATKIPANGQDAPANGGTDKTQSSNAVDSSQASAIVVKTANSEALAAELATAAATEEKSATAESQGDRPNGRTRAGHTDGAAKEPVVAGEHLRANAVSQITAEAATSDQLTQASTKAEAVRKAGKGETTESSDDESGRGAKSSGGAADRNDAISPAKGSPTAAVLAANLQNATDNSAATPDEGKSAVKPVKGHPQSSVGPLGRAMRAATELARSKQSGSSEETIQVDPTRFVGRVTKAFHTAQERGGVLQLRLSPPELGALKLQLVVKDGVLSATLETENAHARRVLLDHLPALRDRLAEQNIRVERFDVDVQQENSRGQADPRGSNQNPYHQQPEQSSPRRGQTDQRQSNETTTLEPTAVATPHIGATEINLIV